MNEPQRRGELLNSNCPSRELLRRLAGRWSLLIMLALHTEDWLRFSELRRKIGGISEKMLGKTLKQMEEDGFIERHAWDVVPPHVEYRLSAFGTEAGQQIMGLTNWLEENVTQILSYRKPSPPDA